MKYYTADDLDFLRGCVLEAVDNLNSIKTELENSFQAPWYITEKAEKAQMYVNAIINRTAYAEERAKEKDTNAAQADK